MKAKPKKHIVKKLGGKTVTEFYGKKWRIILEADTLKKCRVLWDRTLSDLKARRFKSKTYVDWLRYEIKFK